MVSFAAYTHSRNLDLRAAVDGFSPVGFVYEAALPGNFGRDFPSGVAALEHSSFTRLYRLAYDWLGVAPERLLPWGITLEVVLMAAAVLVLMRHLEFSASSGMAFVLVAFVVASSARNMSLARWHFPFFIGQYYGIADFLRILAIVFFFTGQPLRGGALLGAAFTAHPILAIAAGVFIAAGLMIPPRPRALPAAGGLALSAAVAALWAAQTGGLRNHGIPDADWLSLTRLTSMHWYPIELGIFTFIHERAFLPFCAFLLLLTHFLGAARPLSTLDRRMLAGFQAMLGLCVLGVVFSELSSPLLIKLALHRHNDLLVTIGMVYIVGR